MAVAGATVTEADVRDAAELLHGRVRRTPLLTTGELSRRFGTPVRLKAENLQLTGSFKARGATCAVLRLPPDRLGAGVVAASAGNHAQALAFAARAAGARATLYMPAGAPLAKVAAVRQYGGDVRLVDGSYEEAGRVARAAAEDEGRPLVPPFDDPDVVAGQGSVGLEIAADAPDVRLVVVPLGGGGLASGTAIALKAIVPEVRVVAVQAEGRASQTICDGIAVKQPGELTRPLLERYVDEVVTVTDDEVAQAMVLLLERSKLVVEGAGAAGVAALMAKRVNPPAGGETCVVLSGGNVDTSLLSECIRMGETAAGRRMVLVTVITDRPGALADLLRIVAEKKANIVTVEHLREGVDLHLRETAVHLTLQTRGPEHGRELVDAVRDAGFRVRIQTL